MSLLSIAIDMLEEYALYRDATPSEHSQYLQEEVLPQMRAWLRDGQCDTPHCPETAVWEMWERRSGHSRARWVCEPHMVLIRQSNQRYETQSSLPQASKL